MPTDLDSLFAQLARQADAIPLATAEQARQGGRRRTRRQATISAAVAVLLVAVGMGAALYRAERRPGQTAAPTSHALPEVGSPFAFGGTASNAVPSIAGARVFTTWRSEDGTVRLTAADLHTGRAAWSPRTVGKFDAVAGVHALPQAVLVIAIPDQDAVPLFDSFPDRTIYVYDPADGRLRWKFAGRAADDLMYYDRMLVRMSAETGVTTAYDWVTGAVRWTVPAGADRPLRTLGMGTALESMPLRYADERLVRVMKSGQVQVRNAVTGALVRTTAIPPPGPGATYLAYDGWLFDVERSAGVDSPLRVRGTDLSGNGKSVVLTDLAAGHKVGDMWQCGTGRLCVGDMGQDGASTMLTIDVAQQRVLQRVAAPRDGGFGVSWQGYTLLAGTTELVLVDRNGKKTSFGPQVGKANWLGDDALLTMPATGAGIVSKVRLSDGARTPLGTIAGPAPQDMCVNTTTRLVCTTSTAVRIWSLSG